MTPPARTKRMLMSAGDREIDRLEDEYENADPSERAAILDEIKSIARDMAEEEAWREQGEERGWR